MSNEPQTWRITIVDGEGMTSTIQHFDAETMEQRITSALSSFSRSRSGALLLPVHITYWQEP